MRILGIDRFDQRPFLHGFLTGYGMPLLVLVVPLAAGRLDRLLTEGWIYFLLPVFAALGIASYLLMTWMYRVYADRTQGVRFSTGCLAGGCLVGALLLWVASPDRPLENRILVAAAGAPLMVGFWVWIGGLLAYAVQQRRQDPIDVPGHVSR